MCRFGKWYTRLDCSFFIVLRAHLGYYVYLFD